MSACQNATTGRIPSVKRTCSVNTVHFSLVRVRTAHPNRLFGIFVGQRVKMPPAMDCASPSEGPTWRPTRWITGDLAAVTGAFRA